MKIFETKMQVLNQYDKELYWVSGLRVKAFNRELAQKLLDDLDFHYLVLGDEIVLEVECKTDNVFQADWNKMIDYDIINRN